jgi:hypothetical protein
MRTVKICPICARELPVGAVGRCAACHPEAAAIATSKCEWPDSELLPGDGAVFGRYVLGPRLGSGGMGVVHKARDLQVGRDVALKTLAGGQYASALSLSLFQGEIRAFARLDHPHVVPIYEAGEHAGQLYFTMKLLASDLKTELGRFGGDPPDAAQLMEKIALAVHHLHQHGILHRDLKPANILLDTAEPPNPYVADFGVAKQLDEDGQIIRSDVVVGTPAYMAPEQAAGRSVTWAADVYSLGVILYELLVGEPPFQGTARELERAKQSPPRDPRARRPSIDRDLSRICLRCLEAEPERRYPSALTLAVALRRYLDGESMETARWAARTWRWCLRNSMALLLGTLSFVLLAVPSLSTLLAEKEAAERTQAARIREQIIQNNMNSAAMVAGTVLAQLHTLSDSVTDAISQHERELAHALADKDLGVLQEFCVATYAYHEDLKRDERSPFNLWLVMDNEGFILAQYGSMGRPDNLGNQYEWRDYYIGAQRLAARGERGTYVSKAFRSDSDYNHKFAISTPIYGDDGQPRGILVAAIASEANLGSLVLDDTQSVHVLVAPRDRDRYYFPGSRSSSLILRHPALQYGEGIEMVNEQVREVGAPLPGGALWLPDPTRMAAIEGYKDPVAVTHPEFGGSWTAGLAAVGNTGFVVITQTREATPREQEPESKRDLTAQVASWTIVSAVPGALLVGSAAAYGRRRRRRR